MHQGGLRSAQETSEVLGPQPRRQVEAGVKERLAPAAGGWLGGQGWATCSSHSSDGSKEEGLPHGTPVSSKAPSPLAHAVLRHWEAPAGSKVTQQHFSSQFLHHQLPWVAVPFTNSQLLPVPRAAPCPFTPQEVRAFMLLVPEASSPPLQIGSLLADAPL